MANKRELKRDLNYVMGDIIEAAYIHQIANPEADHSKSEAIVDKAIEHFDHYITKINERKVENRGAHLKQVNQDIEKDAKALIKELNAL
ncbi:hypothetical protein [Mesonia sp. K7]|uniref:hypothetical protein n=1 Tax=Mesonia sp. K7 TaxID=2218606 RepID=UPI000DA98714|nr:hypothetical protein [Mesonia sp. K7]PZD78096.1 hypothetical protein DNG35_06915 [Mesonia sp. K7]